MTDHQPRRYSDDEVSKLLKRATDLQLVDPRSPAPRGNGLTLVELQEAALEAGIDPKHIQRAAAELEAPESSTIAETLAGAPLTLIAERLLPGEFDEAGFARIIPEIQRSSKGHGTASTVGSTLTWSSDTNKSTSSLQVTVSSAGGETHIRAEERIHGMMEIIHGLGMGGFGAGAGLAIGLPVGIEVLGSVLFTVGFPIAMLGASYLVGRTLLRRIGKKRRQQIEDMVDRIASHLPPPTALPSGE